MNNIDFLNFQTWRDSGHYRCFSMKFYDSTGQEWHIYGTCPPFGQEYDLTITMLQDFPDESTRGVLGLRARGKGISLAVYNAVSTIQQFRTLQGLGNVF